MTEDPEPYYHGNMKGQKPRIRINPTIDDTTNHQIAAWTSLGLSRGEIIDQLVDFALSQGFCPAMAPLYTEANDETNQS